MKPLISNDAEVLGLLAATLGAIFWAERQPGMRTFFRYVPGVLLCYFIPSVYSTLGLIDGGDSALYGVASRFLLPTALMLLTVAIDLRALARLGPMMALLFLVGAIGVVIGGPAAILIWNAFSPETVAGETWRGLTAIAGSWIGGAANQVAMKEVFAIPDDLFGTMITVDVILTNLWMAVMLWMAANHVRLDARRGADGAAIEALRQRMSRLENEPAPPQGASGLMMIAAVGFGATGLSQALATPLAAHFAQVGWAERMSLANEFFWLIVLVTTLGLLLSLTPVRRIERMGASRVGSVLLYVMIATVGMRMDLAKVFANPGLFGVGVTWIAIHGLLLLLAARLTRAPTFYVAVASQSMIGGAATAPVVAAAFHPSLAPIGVLLSVLGYALGTYGGWLTGQLMRLQAGY